MLFFCEISPLHHHAPKMKERDWKKKAVAATGKFTGNKRGCWKNISTSSSWVLHWRIKSCPVLCQIIPVWAQGSQVELQTEVSGSAFNGNMICKMKCFIKSLIPTPQLGHQNNLTLTFVFLSLRFSFRKCREKLSLRSASSRKIKGF